MVIIGADPHCGSHVADVLNEREQIHGELTVTSNRLRRQRPLDWANRYQPRVWAIECAVPCRRNSSSPVSWRAARVLR